MAHRAPPSRPFSQRLAAAHGRDLFDVDSHGRPRVKDSTIVLALLLPMPEAVSLVGVVLGAGPPPTASTAAALWRPATRPRWHSSRWRGCGLPLASYSSTARSGATRPGGLRHAARGRAWVAATAAELAAASTRTCAGRRVRRVESLLLVDAPGLPPGPLERVAPSFLDWCCRRFGLGGSGRPRAGVGALASCRRGRTGEGRARGRRPHRNAGGVATVSATGMPLVRGGWGVRRGRKGGTGRQWWWRRWQGVHSRSRRRGGRCRYRRRRQWWGQGRRGGRHWGWKRWASTVAAEAVEAAAAAAASMTAAGLAMGRCG